MQWFRFYAEALNNPKVQRLPPDLFKVWVNILCVACQEDGTLPEMDDLAFQIRLNPEEAASRVDALIAAGLIDRTEHGLEPHKWDERQFKSDTSTERTKRYRERHRDVSQNVTPPVTVTPPDTEQIQNRTEEPPVVPQGGRTKGRRFDLEALPEDWRQWARENGHGEPEREFDRFRDYWTAQPGQKGVKADWLATWRNWIRRTVDEGKAPPVTDVAPTTGKPRPTITLRWHSGDLTNYRGRVKAATGTGFAVWLDRLIPDAPGVTTGPEPPEGVMAELSRWAGHYDVSFERVREAA